ncbi:MAG: nitroreductase family protein [Dermatophilaceae bacterium]
MDFETGAGLLHRLTSYTPEREWDIPADDPRVRRDFVPMDRTAFPPFLKMFADGLPWLELPRDLPDPGAPALTVLAGMPCARVPLDAANLGRLLYLCAGVVCTREVRPGMLWLFRAAGSAGGLFPLEVYVSVKGVDGVPDGVHWYDGQAHRLHQVGPPADGEVTTIVVTGVPGRTRWKYAERGWRHVLWDAGTMLSQLLAAAASVGLGPCLRTEFPDAEVCRLVGADGTCEFPVALVTLGRGRPALTPSGDAAPGELTPLEFPLVTAAQRAGDGDVLGDPWPDGVVLCDLASSEPLDTVILRRGSQRLMDRNRTVPRAALVWPMELALRGIDVPHWVVVHGVDDVEPGVYRWPDLTHPIRTGDLRDELDRICLGQTLGADAAYVIISAASAVNLDDRSYRDAQLAAGIVEGRLHLAAFALGASATGMTFLDSEVPDLIGQDKDDTVTLLFTCIGVPEYRSRKAGLPGRPTMVEGRMKERMST